MFNDSLKIALDSFKSAKGRNLLTLVGIMVGVVSIVTIVSLGEGLRHQVKNQIGSFGSDFITIQPGQTVTRDKNGKISSGKLFPGVSSGSLSEDDVLLVRKTTGVKATAPLGITSGAIDAGNKQMPNVQLLATTADFPDIFQRKVLYGGFFSDSEDTKNIAILGRAVAQQLFDENVPIGRSFRIRGQSYLVRGIFEDFPPNPLLLTVDFNHAIFLPLGSAENLLGATPPLYQIFSKPSNGKQIDEVVARLNATLLNAHGGQQDFTILKGDDQIAAAGGLLHAVTNAVAAIAIIALIIGGISVMNVMLVAVTERTREVGIRKAIGATNHQILSQFMIEAGLLSLMGGVLGVVAAYILSFLIRLSTSLEPVIPLWIVLLTIGGACLIGGLFGIAPALKAARKDPIEALRYE